MGTMISRILGILGISRECGKCAELRRDMDRNGIWWCWSRRSDIVAKIAANAHALGYRGSRVTCGAWIVFLLAITLSLATIAFRRLKADKPPPTTSAPPPVPVVIPPDPVKLPVNNFACDHRGQRLREISHQCCGATAPLIIPVFACEKFGECTLNLNVGGATCRLCSERTSGEAATPAPAVSAVTVGDKRQSAAAGDIDAWKARKRAKHAAMPLRLPPVTEHGDEADLSPLTDVTRNMMYYIYPVAASEAIWKRNIALLKRRMGVFNGKRIVCVATDDDSSTLDDVVREFGDTAIEFIRVDNHPILGEVSGFAPMMEHVRSSHSGDITFYGHAKGVRHKDSEIVTVHAWTAMMYEICLDYMPLVERHLGKYAITGAFKKIGKQFTHSESLWHYTGTFFWFRNTAAFRDDGWRLVDKIYGGVEAWPGIRFRETEGGALFLSGTAASTSMYSMSHLHDEILPRLDGWRARHAHLQTLRDTYG